MNLRALALAGAILVGGCGNGDPSGGDPQANALADLEAETGVLWSVRYHPDVHTPAFLDGRTAPIARAPSEAAGAARNFFAAHAALFLLGATAELAHDATDTDEIGMSHARFVQTQGGVPVWGAGLTAHFATDGALVRVHGRYLPLPPIDLAPVLAASDATQIAIGVARARSTDDAAAVTTGSPSLVIDPGPVPRDPDLPPRLAWRVEVWLADPTAPARTAEFVDAKSGQPYRTEPLLDAIAGSGDGVFGDRQTLQIAAGKTRFSLEDDLAGQKTYSAENGSGLPGHLVVSDRADRWDAIDPGHGAAVDAHAYAAVAYHYYATAHGRSGWDGAGHGMRATVHYGHAYDGAFWDGRQIVFGDGDGTRFAPLAGALDLVAHEYTHAVIESAAQLDHSDETGALGEGIADLFACFVERSARGALGNWQIGEEVYRPGEAVALRDPSDPHRTHNPAHVSEQIDTSDDNGGVHLNSTIASHAGYLLSEGGTNAVSHLAVSGIGAAAAQQIWYRALVRYLSPSASFRDAADATLAAARDLYGDGARADSVVQAWRAVGVLP